MDKEQSLDSHAPSQMAGFLCTMQELRAVLSNLLEPGQVFERASTVTPTVVWAPKVQHVKDRVHIILLCRDSNYV